MKPGHRSETLAIAFAFPGRASELIRVPVDDDRRKEIEPNLQISAGTRAGGFLSGRIRNNGARQVEFAAGAMPGSAAECLGAGWMEVVFLVLSIDHAPPKFSTSIRYSRLSLKAFRSLLVRFPARNALADPDDCIFKNALSKTVLAANKGNIMEPLEFNTIDDYLDLLFQNPLRFAIILRKMGGKALNLSRAGIEARINAGRLKVVTIGNSRFLCAKEVIETFQGDCDLASKAREILEDCARNRKSTTYGPFMSELGMTTQSPHHRSKIGSILGTLSKDTFSKDGNLLSVLVHRQSEGKTRPSPAIFKLAAD